MKSNTDNCGKQTMISNSALKKSLSQHVTGRKVLRKWKRIKSLMKTDTTESGFGARRRMIARNRINLQQETKGQLLVIIKID